MEWTVVWWSGARTFARSGTDSTAAETGCDICGLENTTRPVKMQLRKLYDRRRFNGCAKSRRPGDTSGVAARDGRTSVED
jgi:hypothetical protein